MVTQFPGRPPWSVQAAAPGTPRHAALSPDPMPFGEGSCPRPRRAWAGSHTEQGTGRTRSRALLFTQRRLRHGARASRSQWGMWRAGGWAGGPLAVAEASALMPQKGLSLVTVPSPATLLMSPLRCQMHAVPAAPQPPTQGVGRAACWVPSGEMCVCGGWPRPECTVVSSLHSALSLSARQQDTQRPLSARRGTHPGLPPGG